MWKQLNTLGIEKVSLQTVQRRFGLPADSISESEELEAVVTVSLWDGVGEAILESGVLLSDDDSESTQRGVT